jgi:hypothetical protein
MAVDTCVRRRCGRFPGGGVEIVLLRPDRHASHRGGVAHLVEDLAVRRRGQDEDHGRRCLVGDLTGVPGRCLCVFHPDEDGDIGPGLPDHLADAVVAGGHGEEVQS